MATAKHLSQTHTGEQLAEVLSKQAAELTRAEVRFLWQCCNISDKAWDIPLGEMFEYQAAHKPAESEPVTIGSLLVEDAMEKEDQPE